jgi:hypothetical protein
MKSLQIKETSFLGKLNNYFYNNKPKTTCELNKRLIYMFFINLFSLPSLFFFVIIRWFKRKDESFARGNTHFIYTCLYFHMFMTIMGIMIMFGDKTFLKYSLFTKIIGSWLYAPIIFFIIIIIVFILLLLVKIVLEYIASIKKPIVSINPLVKKEKKPSVIKELYNSFKNKYCSKIEWI